MKCVCKQFDEFRTVDILFLCSKCNVSEFLPRVSQYIVCHCVNVYQPVVEKQSLRTAIKRKNVTF